VACPYHGQRDPGLLGFCQLLPSFIANYSAIARPLFDLTLKDTAFQWTPAHQAAFAALYFPVYPSPVLALPDHTQPFRLIMDASDFATGAILEQPDLLNRWHPVAYFSKSLQLAERNYAIHDKELLPLSVLLLPSAIILRVAPMSLKSGLIMLTSSILRLSSG